MNRLSRPRVYTLSLSSSLSFFASESVRKTKWENRNNYFFVDIPLIHVYTSTDDSDDDDDGGDGRGDDGEQDDDHYGNNDDENDDDIDDEKNHVTWYTYVNNCGRYDESRYDTFLTLHTQDSFFFFSSHLPNAY